MELKGDFSNFQLSRAFTAPGSLLKVIEKTYCPYHRQKLLTFFCDDIICDLPFVRQVTLKNLLLQLLIQMHLIRIVINDPNRHFLINQAALQLAF